MMITSRIIMMMIIIYEKRKMMIKYSPVGIKKYMCKGGIKT